MKKHLIGIASIFISFILGGLLLSEGSTRLRYEKALPQVEDIHRPDGVVVDPIQDIKRSVLGLFGDYCLEVRGQKRDYCFRKSHVLSNPQAQAEFAKLQSGTMVKLKTTGTAVVELIVRPLQEDNQLLISYDQTILKVSSDYQNAQYGMEMVVGGGLFVLLGFLFGYLFFRRIKSL